MKFLKPSFLLLALTLFATSLFAQEVKRYEPVPFSREDSSRLSIEQVEKKYNLSYWGKSRMKLSGDVDHYIYSFQENQSDNMVFIISQNYNEEEMPRVGYDTIVKNGKVGIFEYPILQPSNDLLSLEVNYLFKLDSTQRLNLSYLNIDDVYYDLFLVEDKDSEIGDPVIFEAYIVSRDGIERISEKGMVGIGEEYFYNND